MNSESINDWVNRSALYAALIVAWVATLGSLYFSEVLGYIPCQLCWYQRIFMYPMAGLLALGLLRFDRQLPHLVIPFTLVGGTISAYHYLLQKTDLFDSAATCQVGVPCSTAWINWFGFVTIPFLALLAFFLITVFSLVAMFAGEPQEREDQTIPWLPVGGTVGAVIAVFAVMTFTHQQPKPALASGPGDSGASAALSAVSPPAGEAAPSQDLAAGADLYRQACAACHGPDATGIEHLGNPLLTSYVLALPNEEALAFVREGVDLANPRNSTGLVMPASGGRPDLSDEQLLSILEFLCAESQAAPAQTP